MLHAQLQRFQCMAHVILYHMWQCAAKVADSVEQPVAAGASVLGAIIREEHRSGEGKGAGCIASVTVDTLEQHTTCAVSTIPTGLEVVRHRLD